MISDIKYLPVNWVEGMKISKHHLEHLENGITDRVRDAASGSLNSFNYGLLPTPGKVSGSLKLSERIDPAGLLRLRLTECHAVTAGGVRIYISENSSRPNVPETSINLRSAGKFFVVISVNPFERKPFGQPDPEESPLRYPFTDFAYTLEIVPEEKMRTDIDPVYHLVIGRLDTLNQELFLNPDYIPPSASAGAFPKLMEEYHQLGDALGKLCQNATGIIQKVKTEKVKTDLALNVMYLSEKVVFSLTDKIAPYRMVFGEMPPVFFIQAFVSLVYIVRSAINCLTENDKENMFSYFQTWTDLSAAQLQEKIERVSRINYNHQDIAASVVEIRDCISVFSKLFDQLGKLKFIGDPGSTGIVIGESTDGKKTEPNHFSFLSGL